MQTTPKSAMRRPRSFHDTHRGKKRHNFSIFAKLPFGMSEPNLHRTYEKRIIREPLRHDRRRRRLGYRTGQHLALPVRGRRERRGGFHFDLSDDQLPDFHSDHAVGIQSGSLDQTQLDARVQQAGPGHEMEMGGLHGHSLRFHHSVVLLRDRRLVARVSQGIGAEPLP